MNDKLLTTAEVAERLRVSPSTLRYWHGAHEGPPVYRIGRRLMYREADVEHWFQRQRDAGPSGDAA